MDQEGHRGAAHAQRGPRAAAGAIAPRARGAARPPGAGPASRRRRHALGEDGGRARRRHQGLWRTDADPRFHDPHPRRRPDRPHRPERRGQDDAAEADPGRARARRRQGPPRRQCRGRVFRSVARGARPRCHGAGHHQPGRGLGRNRHRAPARDQLPRRFPVPAGARAINGAVAVGRRAQPPAPCPAAGATGQCAGAGRAHQRPRHRNARAPGVAAAGVPRHDLPGEP